MVNPRDIAGERSSRRKRSFDPRTNGLLRDRQTDRQTDRQIDRQTETDRQPDRQTEHAARTMPDGSAQTIIRAATLSACAQKSVFIG